MADWIESHAALREHPKRKRLSRCLDLETHATVGLLHCLWWWAMDYAPDGDLGDYTAEDIADGVEWEGDPGELLDALRECGFVDGMVLHGQGLLQPRRTNARPGAAGWRQRVLERDEFMCQTCGSTDQLQAHHIRHWATHPDLRLVVENGVTLCSPCHKAAHRSRV